MTSSLRLGFEYNKLAVAFNKVIATTEFIEITFKEDDHTYIQKKQKEVIVLAEYYKKEISDRIDKYGWPIDMAKITVTAISKERIPLSYALQFAFERIKIIGERLGIASNVDKIIVGKS